MSRLPYLPKECVARPHTCEYQALIILDMYICKGVSLSNWSICIWICLFTCFTVRDIPMNWLKYILKKLH